MINTSYLLCDVGVTTLNNDDDDVLIRPFHFRECCRVGTSEQNRAATKLQAIFRKRNEMKRLNDEYIKTLPQPSLKQCYRGHRNSRTMVIVNIRLFQLLSLI